MKIKLITLIRTARSACAAVAEQDDAGLPQSLIEAVENAAKALDEVSRPGCEIEGEAVLNSLDELAARYSYRSTKRLRQTLEKNGFMPACVLPDGTRLYGSGELADKIVRWRRMKYAIPAEYDS